MSATNQVGHDLNAVAFADGRGNADRTGTATHHMALHRTIGEGHLLQYLAVEGDVDVGRVVGHEAVDGGRNALHAVTLQRGQELEGKARGVGALGFVYEFNYIHRLLGMSFLTVSTSIPRRRA